MKPKVASHPELTKKLPIEVQTIFKVFGDEIRLVGGCVRDLLLQKELNDFDFATKKLPHETIAILEKNAIKAVPTGVKFGTITAVINHKNFEITTLRQDNETDGRHCNPQFVDDFYFDAARRDFTVNALYLDAEGLVTDYFDGISDLKAQKIRFIGVAQNRIEEDYLRILRFFRFSCEYAKSLDNEGLQACIAQKENLQKLSRERIRAEFRKMLMSKNHNNLLAILHVMQKEKIASVIFSSELDLKAFENFIDWEKKLQISANFIVKFATILTVNNYNNSQIFREICATNAEKKQLEFFAINHHQTCEEIKPYKALIADFVPQNLVLELYFLNCVKNGQFTDFEKLQKNYSELQNFVLPQFPVVSQDLSEKGYAGKDLGAALKKLKDLWVASDFILQKSDLINMLK